MNWRPFECAETQKRLLQPTENRKQMKRQQCTFTISIYSWQYKSSNGHSYEWTSGHILLTNAENGNVDVDRSLSDSWTRLTMFTFLSENVVWEATCKNSSKHQTWRLKYGPACQNRKRKSINGQCSELRGIHFDRSKLEIPVAAPTPCKLGTTKRPNKLLWRSRSSSWRKVVLTCLCSWMPPFLLERSIISIPCGRNWWNTLIWDYIVSWSCELGICTQRECKPNEGMVDDNRKMLKSRISVRATEKLIESDKVQLYKVRRRSWKRLENCQKSALSSS